MHMRFHSGYFNGETPFVRIGKGSRTLVIFPHIRDTLEDLTKAAWSRRWLKRFRTANSNVCIIGRKKNMPPGYSTGEMAADYARIIARHLGPSCIMGFSLGGLVAQHFAATWPHLVQSLVLAVTAHRITPGQHPWLRQWITQARDNQWRAVYLEIASLMFTPLGTASREQVLPFLNRAIHRGPHRAADFIVSLDASLSHNSEAAARKITAPTLIVGGGRDRLFPQETMLRFSTLIPHADYTLLREAGHGAFDECKRDFDRVVNSFMEATAC